MTIHSARIVPLLAVLLALNVLGCSDGDDDPSVAGGAGASGGTGGTGGKTDSGTKPTYPKLLSEAGLFDDVANETLAPGVRFYQPQYLLWSDSSTKRRWFYLPPGTQIDTSNMDHWMFPEGTKAFKEFSRDGVRIETRMLHKAGPTQKDWLMIAYLWNDAGTDAEAVPLGAADAHGTPHDVPNTGDCSTCHIRMPDVLAGVSALQLSHGLEGITLQTLADEGALTSAPPASLAVPGDAVASSALGYMHANCGLCHNTTNDVYEKTKMQLWLTTASLASVETTTSYTTTVGQTTELPMPDTAITQRIAPGEPDDSMIVLRMSRRSPQAGPMPPIGTELVDDVGLSAVRAWISALTP